jgi:hypothetical protein
MRELDAETARGAENGLAGADVDLAIVDRESLGGRTGGRVVAVVARLRFVTIAHHADLGLPVSQRLGQFIRKIL